MKTSRTATDRPGFIRRQYAFAANIRDPENAPPPEDVEERRMAIYRELFYNNVEGFLSNTFPVLRKLYDDTRWHGLVRDYFSHHRSQTPLFLEIPREFLSWLKTERGEQPGDLPFLQELAHYEWVELALAVSEATPSCPVEPGGDPGQGVPVLSPLAWHLSYRYPVHRIGPDYQPAEPGDVPTCLVVYRDGDDAVGFLEINPVTKRLLELVEAASGATGEELLHQIAAEMSHPHPETVVSGGLETLNSLREKGIILGTRRN